MPRIDRSRWKTVSALLDQLLDVDEPQRRIRLDEIRLDDRCLAVELEGLLAQDTAANRHAFLDGSVLPMDMRREGETVGSYTLQTLMGRGGMGSVWLARRSDGRFEGRAAIKFLNLSSMCPRGMQLFHREGSLLARLAHPNIARLFDAGVADNGQPYLVLEHVEGAPLDEWCSARATGANGCVRVLIDVLAAVSHAHDQQILHRDLKPSNILVTPSGQVKLLDFGIAKLMGDEHDTALAADAAPVASPAFTLDFAAPEQVQMRPLTCATDVYALGVILYLLLTGVHPTARRCAPSSERLRAIVEVEPVRLSVAGGVAFSRDLESIVAKALSKLPSKRYATARAMADDLRRHLRGEPVSARPLSRACGLLRLARRHGQVVRTVALVAAAFAAGGLAVPLLGQTRLARPNNTSAMPPRMTTAQSVNLTVGGSSSSSTPAAPAMTGTLNCAAAAAAVVKAGKTAYHSA